MEIGGLLDPIGRLWGYSVALVLLAFVPDKKIMPNRLRSARLVFLSCAGLCLISAFVTTVYADSRDLLTWSAVPSALITAGAFFVGCRLAFAVVKRFSKQVPTSVDDRQAPADDHRL